MIDGLSGGWKNHPAVRMWRNHKTALICYYNTMLYEWQRRGYKNKVLSYEKYEAGTLVIPEWIGNEKFHASHRSNLLRKDPEWYGQFGWNEPNDLPYVWPIPKRDMEE